MNQFLHIVHVINIAPGNFLLSYFVAVISVFVFFFFFLSESKNSGDKRLGGYQNLHGRSVSM